MVFESSCVSKPVPDATLARWIRDQAEAYGDRTAFIDGPSGRSYTFRQLLGHAASIAHALIARGVRPGDRVAFVCPNVPETALAYHGAITAGAVAMMINPLATSDELIKYFGVGKPSLVVTVPMFVETVRTAAPGLPIVVLGAAPGAEPLTALLGGPATPPVVDISPDAIAVMPYSSGTTGFPKGVMLTHRNIIAQCISIQAKPDSPVVIDDSRMLAVLPFFHIYGIMVFLTYGVARGNTTVTMPRFDLEQFLQLARTHEIPQLHVVPPILLALAKYPGDLQLPKLRLVLAGAAPLSAELAAELTARTGAVIYQAYGMTEVSGATHLGSVDPARNKPGSIGSLIGNARTKLVSTDTGEEVGVGERGELWVRGPFVMAGYFEDPAATAQTIDAEGWLHTGDVGYVDPDGDFFVVDRVKELIKYKGFQVAPAELEAVLLQHPAVADAAVYSSPDPEAGEIPKAAVVLKAGASTTAEALLEFVQERVSPHKRVRAVTFVAQIPKSASGKILRRVLVAADK